MIKIIILVIVILILISLVVYRINNLTFFNRIPRPLMISILVSITLLFFISIRFLNNIESQGTYTPAKYDGKHLIPGKVEFDKK